MPRQNPSPPVEKESAATTGTGNISRYVKQAGPAIDATLPQLHQPYRRVDQCRLLKGDGTAAPTAAPPQRNRVALNQLQQSAQHRALRRHTRGAANAKRPGRLEHASCLGTA